MGCYLHCSQQVGSGNNPPSRFSPHIFVWLFLSQLTSKVTTIPIHVIRHIIKLLFQTIEFKVITHCFKRRIKIRINDLLIKKDFVSYPAIIYLKQESIKN